ncbi:SUMF1/EgtB/PvdO family nonheme iron enzyme [Fibrobacter sp. UWB12]|uniref:formylglycine-generating enzyme family protein n=1 Tax=Fibrobacter sp. UWB12 TaxID=1896203 RepID=UPI0009342E79|nr:SUMF1/EgtB/PvdO family nonheme iron enzyme [Fibrobacter sp. UWB12]
MKKKRLLVAICVGFAIASIALMCQIDDANGIDNVMHFQRTFDLNRDSLGSEMWLEVEKNESVKICLDSKVRAWETSLDNGVLNDSCLKIQIPTLIGVYPINVKFYDSDSACKINLAVGMKYLDLKNEEVLLGFNNYTEQDIRMFQHINEDPERLVSITGTYLIDKYPVTNCEIIQTMWDSIPLQPTYPGGFFKDLAELWILRKKASVRYENCPVHDTAASSIFLFQAIKYANERSKREGLKPYYVFSKTTKDNQAIISRKKYIISYLDFNNPNDVYIQVSVDESSDGYRLPYYDEWMMFARGGDKKKRAIWGNYSSSLQQAQMYANFGIGNGYTQPVGQLKPNGYGLYDIFGLVWEHVLFEEDNPFSVQRGSPSCLKGGNNRALLEPTLEVTYEPYWKIINYGYSAPNYTGGRAEGFRLIRNIGNNAKWSEIKTVDEN